MVSTYNILRIFRLKGDLKIKVIEESLNEIVRRHNSLRISSLVVDREDDLVISPFTLFQMPFHDFSDLPKNEVGSIMNDAIEENEMLCLLVQKRTCSDLSFIKFIGMTSFLS